MYTYVYVYIYIYTYAYIYIYICSYIHTYKVHPDAGRGGPEARRALPGLLFAFIIYIYRERERAREIYSTTYMDIVIVMIITMFYYYA